MNAPAADTQISRRTPALSMAAMVLAAALASSPVVLAPRGTERREHGVGAADQSRPPRQHRSRRRRARSARPRPGAGLHAAGQGGDLMTRGSGRLASRWLPDPAAAAEQSHLHHYRLSPDGPPPGPTAPVIRRPRLQRPDAGSAQPSRPGPAAAASASRQSQHQQEAAAEDGHLEPERALRASAAKSMPHRARPAAARTRLARGRQRPATRSPADGRRYGRIGRDEPGVQAGAELPLDRSRGRRGQSGRYQPGAQLRSDGSGGRPDWRAEQAEEDHADYRDSDRSAELQAGVEHAGGRACILLLGRQPAGCPRAVPAPRPCRAPRRSGPAPCHSGQVRAEVARRSRSARSFRQS